MMKNVINSHSSLNKQRGAAVLLVSIVLLIGVTLITVFAARVGVIDQRIAGNEYRHKEAKAAADAALDQTAAFISNNTNLYSGTASNWVTCTGSFATLFPCLKIDGSTYDLAYDGDLTTTTTIESLQSASTPLAIELSSGISADSYLTYTASSSIGNVLNAIGTASSLDGTANAYAQVSYSQTTLLTPGKIPPIMTPIIDLKGNFSIVPDPNAGGQGVPISAWVATLTVQAGGSWQTCQHGEFRNGNSGAIAAGICNDTLNDSVSWSTCNCLADGTLSDSSGGVSYDIVESPGDFPDSAFSYLFPGIPNFTALLTTQDVLTPTDCSGIDALANTFTKSTIVAVDGDCDISGGIIGSRDKPIILVVNGTLAIQGNPDIYGIALGITAVTIKGGAIMHGSMLSEANTKLTAGTYKQVYDEYVHASLKDDLESVGLAKQRYSWIDIKP